MQGTDFKYPVQSRVRLRDGIESTFYNGFGRVGNEGVVLAHRLDHFGLPEIFVKWDQEHWAYNRQPDCWTFEEHFDLVEGLMTEQDNMREALAGAANGFVENLMNIIGGQDLVQPVDAALFAAEEADSMANLYRSRVAKAIEALNESEAFIVVVVSRSEDPRAPDGALLADHYEEGMTPEAKALVGAQAAAVVARDHAETALRYVSNLTEEDG